MENKNEKPFCCCAWVLNSSFYSKRFENSILCQNLKRLTKMRSDKQNETFDTITTNNKVNVSYANNNK